MESPPPRHRAHGQASSGTSTDRTRLRRRGSCAGDGALADASARRAAAVAKDARSLRPRPPPVPDFPQPALGQEGHAERVCGAGGHRRQGLHGDAPRRRHCRAFADAGAGGLAFIRALSRTRRQRQGRRPVRHPRAQGCKEPAEADPDGCRQALCGCRRARRRGARSLDLGARRRRDGAALRFGPAHLRGAGTETARRAQARRRRRSHRDRQGQQDPDGAGAAERACR